MTFVSVDMVFINLKGAIFTSAVGLGEYRTLQVDKSSCQLKQKSLIVYY